MTSMTKPNDQSADHTTSPASSAQGYWAGWLSLAFAATGMVLIFVGDPFWLGLPISVLASPAGWYALRRGQDKHVGAHLGFNFGLFNLFLWLLLIVVVPHVFKLDPTSLFTIPSYD